MRRDLQTKLDEELYAECCEQATVDAYGESELASGWLTMLDDHVTVPFKTDVLGIEAVVTKFDITDDDQIVAIVSRDGSKLTVRLQDLTLLSNRLPDGTEWIMAYQRWASERA